MGGTSTGAHATPAAVETPSRPGAPWTALALALLVCLLAVVAAAGPSLVELTGVSTIANLPQTAPDGAMAVDNPPIYSDPIERRQRLRPGFAAADWVGIALVCVVVGAAAALLVPRLVRVLRARTRRAAPGDPAAIAGTSSVLDVGAAPRVPALAVGAQAAERLLDDVADPRDAVVAAWLALESAAAGSGAHRRPAQTPTEFTTAVLAATGADPAAVDALLGLYLRARFTTAERRRTGPADVAAARVALTALADSWGRRGA